MIRVLSLVRATARSVLLRTYLLAVFGALSLMSLNAAATERTLLIYGDSLSAAYGIALDKGWVSLLTTKLRDSHPDWQVVNVSISGETTSGGVSRLPEVLKDYAPDVVFLELGANDGLRGTQLKSIKSNLKTMISQIKKARARPVLAEMRIPPNYGPFYTKGFNKIFHDLGKSTDTPVVPFMLEGVAGQPGLNLPDGIHPKAVAQPRVLENIWPTLKPALKEVLK